MAVKRTQIEVQAVSLEQARAIFANRKTATPAELLAAQQAIEKRKVVLQNMSEELNDTILGKNLPDIEAMYGPNPMLVLVDKDPKTGTITKTNVLFKEKMVTESNVDKKAILALGGLVPGKYIVEKKDLDKTAVLNDPMAGTLDPSIMAHVSVHTDLKFVVEKRAGEKIPGPSATPTVSTPTSDKTAN